jgi:hypothetical protein
MSRKHVNLGRAPAKADLPAKACAACGLRGLRPAVQLAQEVGAGLGSGEILLGPLS